MAIPDTAWGRLVGQLVADGLQKVCLAEPHSAVDEQRVVRNSRIFGHLDRSGARQLLALPVTKLSNENARLDVHAPNRRYFACTALRRLRRARGGIGAACENQADAEVGPAASAASRSMRATSARHVFEHEAVGCSENQRVGPGTGSSA